MDEWGEAPAGELKGYEAAFAARGLAIPDDSAVRLTLRNRFPDLRAETGKVRFRSSPSTTTTTGRRRPLNPLWKNSERSGTTTGSRRLTIRAGSGGFLKAEMNRDLVDRIGQWVAAERPDVIFTYLSGNSFPRTVQAIRSFGVPMVHFSLNDKEHFVGKVRGGLAFGSRDICRWFDLCWTSTEDALKKYCVEGALPVYLPEGANPELHRPLEQQSIDVSFVGQCYGNRPETIQPSRAEGIRVEAFGYGWPRRSLSTEEMVRLYAKSRINLGFGVWRVTKKPTASRDGISRSR
ncbi:MAG: DUF3880 domain-containing protein [Desulfobacterales bacterium]|nr:DUF3880 domain-containing protein [Desulfobacterales bacterium]